jgi:flagellar hook-basal body complex protein FliE
MEIKGLDPSRAVAPVGQAEREPAAAKGAGADFGTVLRQSLVEVNQLQGEADAAVEALVTGKGISLHDTMIALEKADLSFRLMMQVRNKIVQAYRDVLNMQV